MLNIEKSAILFNGRILFKFLFEYTSIHLFNLLQGLILGLCRDLLKLQLRKLLHTANDLYIMYKKIREIVEKKIPSRLFTNKVG